MSMKQIFLDNKLRQKVIKMDSFQQSQNNEQLGDLPSLNNFPNSVVMLGTVNTINFQNSMNFLGNDHQNNQLDEDDSLGIRLKHQNHLSNVAQTYLQCSKITPRKKKSGCTCKKTKCLKMYCECFSSGIVCQQGCNCQECFNLEEYRSEIEQAKHLVKSKGNIKRKCTCKKSHCQKKYCECYNLSLPCTQHCKCRDCFNQDKTYTHKEEDRNLVLANSISSARQLLL